MSVRVRSGGDDEVGSKRHRNKRDHMSANAGEWETKYMIGFAIDSMGAVDDACVGDGVVGESGRAMGSIFSESD